MPKNDPTHAALTSRIEGLSREVERLGALASRERGLLEAILSFSPHGIIVSDANGKLFLQNKAAEKIWAGSATANTIEGWGQYRAFHPDGRPFEPTDWSLARALTRKESVEAEEIHIQRFDDSHAMVLGSAAPIFRADGELEGALAIFVDITDLKRHQEEVRIVSERYFTTLRSIGDAVIGTDAGGRIDFMNPIAEALTGWTVEDARGRPLLEVFRIVNEHTRLEVESPADKVIREGKVVGLANHTILIARDGTEIAIDDSGAPIYNSKGELVGVVLVFRDVTEKRLEDDRRSFIAGATTLLSSSLDYVLTLSSVAKLAVPKIADWCAVDIVQPDGGLRRVAITHVDPQKIRWAKELQARYPPDPASPHGVPAAIRTGKSILMEEIPESLLTQVAVDDEHLRLLRELGLRSAMIVPLRWHGRVLGAISFIAAESRRLYGEKDMALAEELAEVAALAIENARLYHEAQDANRAKDEFLATVSHELRTPLNAMLGWANLLRTGEVSEATRDQGLEVIERNARAQARIIDDLLDVSRIISGNLHLECCSVDLLAVIESALEVVRPAADSKRIRLEFRSEEHARKVTGDPMRLQQVVWNLLSNAVKFTDHGGEVTISVALIDAQVEIRVVDTGIGIEPDFVPFLFERFKQANATRTRSYDGLGLGLAIVKHLVELHGGSVGASSRGSGEGAEFRVRIPVVAAAAPAVTGGLPAGVAPTEVARLDGLHVLVVDDELDARTLLTEILERHGAQVRAVASAAEGLAEVLRAQPDVLVSDIGMPEEDGYSFIQKVRSVTKAGAKPLPAAALTAYARTEDRTRALLAGFQSHIAKPVEPQELLLVVATLAGRTSAG